MTESKKIFWLIMWITALCQAAMVGYAPALPAIAQALHADPSAIKSSLSIFLLGNGFSQLFYGPFSDRHGRKPLMLIGLVIFSIGCLLNAWTTSLFWFQMARLLQGIGSGSTVTICRAILRDKFHGRDLASATSYLSMGFALGLAFPQILGAYLLNFFDWQAIFIFLFLFCVLMALVTYRWLPETHTQFESHIPIKQFCKNTLKDYLVIIQHRRLWKFLIGGLFAYAVVIAYNVMSPFLIQTVLGYSPDFYGWLSLLIAVPYYLAAVINKKTVLITGTTPTFRIGSILILVSGLYIFAITKIMPVHLFWTIMLPLMVATFSQGFVWPNAIAEALQIESSVPGRLSAMFSSLQMLLVSGMSSIMAFVPDSSPMYLAGVITILGIAAGLILRK